MPEGAGIAQRRHERGHHDNEDREVGQVGVDRTDVDGRLVVPVQKEGGERGSEDQRAGAVARAQGRQEWSLYSCSLMRSRVIRRRAATAFGIYGAALVGFLATIVAARELSVPDFARFAVVFATTSLLQLFVDLTIDEVVVKY